MKKKLFAWLLALTMVLSMLPMTALAADNTQLVLCDVEWTNGSPVPSDNFVYGEYEEFMFRTAYWFPALLSNGELILLDPADLYSSNPDVLTVSPMRAMRVCWSSSPLRKALRCCMTTATVTPILSR